jgi:selenocysteine lyase/cysteine desulfurase
VVIDGYHQFLALPTDIGPIEDRVFFLAGGYKYAMAGEGVCFLHCPPDYGPRPVDTGWYAGFGELEEGVSGKVGYNADATRFAGATYDPSGIYRLRAVLAWLEAIGITPADIHQRVTRLQEQFLSSSPNLGELVPESGLDRGNFLTFRSEQAGDMYRALHDRGVITDYRGDRLRIGFGIYHDQSDVDRLLDVVASLG